MTTVKSYVDALGVVTTDSGAGVDPHLEAAEISAKYSTPEEPELIQELRELKDFKAEYQKSFYFYEGFEVKTNKQTIYALIETGHLCCEEYGSKLELPGWMKTPKGLAGAALHRVYWGKDPEAPAGKSYCDWNARAVIMDTSKGRVRIVLYNYHNGYYVHRFRVAWNNYLEEDVL